MAHRKTERNPLFAGRWFEDDIILLCLRWYFRFKLSYRDLVAILGERGLSISHTTILRWVIRYAETCEKRWSRFERQVGGSWRVDETFIKVRGQLMYLYRAVDGQGNTVEFFLSRTRGIAAAKAFFRKALKHHREPHSITLDGHRPSHSALRRMGMNGEFNFRGPNPVRIRRCQYLNNVVEQDHRRVKGRLRPMLGFKTFYNARRVIIGIELAQKIHKRQFAIPITWRSNPAVIWRHVTRTQALHVLQLLPISKRATGPVDRLPTFDCSGIPHLGLRRVTKDSGATSNWSSKKTAIQSRMILHWWAASAFVRFGRSSMTSLIPSASVTPLGT